MIALASDSGLTDVLGAVDGPWALLALITIGVFYLLNKFGNSILALLKVNAEKTEQIQQSIITNHGSANIGDAVDRLTSRVMNIERNVTDQGNIISLVQRDQETHIRECREYYGPGNFVQKEAI